MPYSEKLSSSVLVRYPIDVVATGREDESLGKSTHEFD